MEIKENLQPEAIVKEADGTFNLTEEQHLKLKIDENNELNEKVPQGKKWVARVNVHIVETPI